VPRGQVTFTGRAGHEHRGDRGGAVQDRAGQPGHFPATAAGCLAGGVRVLLLDCRSHRRTYVGRHQDRPGGQRWHEETTVPEQHLHQRGRAAATGRHAYAGAGQSAYGFVRLSLVS